MGGRGMRLENNVMSNHVDGHSLQVPQSEAQAQMVLETGLSSVHVDGLTQYGSPLLS